MDIFENDCHYRHDARSNGAKKRSLMSICDSESSKLEQSFLM